MNRDKPTTPAPRKVTVPVWDGMACRYIDTPARECVECGAVWLASNPPFHYRGCLVAEVKESFR